MPWDMRAVETDFLATAPYRFTFHSVIARPPERVFEAIAEKPESWGEWYPGFDHSGRWLTADPPAAGSRRAVRMARMTYEETILAWEPTERFAFRVDRATTPIAYALAEDYRISPHPTGSTLEWTFAVDPRSVLKPTMRFARPLMARLFRTSSARLEKYLPK